MNWGYKILFIYLSFIVMMLSMVYVSSRQTNEMQDENYYAKELAYQSVIDGKNNLNALSDKLTIVCANDSVKIRIPKSAITNISEGTIYFLRPSNKKYDVNEILVVDNIGEQLISKSRFKKGYYIVKINWKSNSMIYYAEQKFNME